MGQRDRISELPADILDEILGFLPIEQAARMAVLSTFWRDMWFSLTKLNFDGTFFYHIERKYSHVHSDIRTQSSQEKKKNKDIIWTSAALYVINKVLNQHNGLIRMFVIKCMNIDMNTLCTRSFDLEQWFLFVTMKGVEEIHFSVMSEDVDDDDEYMLPSCIFSCLTLRRLHLFGVSVELINAHCILPNITSLCFDFVDFIGRKQTVEAPMLENLSFTDCDNMTKFNIIAQKLDSLAIHARFYQFPVNLNLSSVRTLDFDSYALKDFINGFPRWGLQLQSLNVEHLILDLTGDISSAFIHLLRICPKLFKLDITLSFLNVYPQLLEEFHNVAQGHKVLYTLKLNEFVACKGYFGITKRLLACFPALEEVVIIRSRQCCYSDEAFKNYKDKLLRFPCASKKTKVIVLDK